MHLYIKSKHLNEGTVFSQLSCPAWDFLQNSWFVEKEIFKCYSYHFSTYMYVFLNNKYTHIYPLVDT